MKRPRKRVFNQEKCFNVNFSNSRYILCNNNCANYSKSISIPIFINCGQSNEKVKTLGLIDSGAGGEFIDQNYARNSGFKIQKLEEPLQPFVGSMALV